MYTAPVGTLAVRRGALSGLLATGLILIAAFPSRLSLAIRGWGPLPVRLEHALVGTFLDASAVVLIFTPLVIVGTLLVPLLFKRARSPFWQTLGAPLIAWPLGFSLWVLTVVAQEVKSERGSFPTMFDLLEGGSNASFVEGTLGFIRYERIWLPGAVGAALALIVMTFAWRRPRLMVEPWRRWALGMGLGTVTSAVMVVLLVATLSALANRFTAAAIGDPLTGLVESTFDLAQHKGPATPRELVLDAELPPGSARIGEQRVGWPAAKTDGPHPHARPLDFAKEGPTRDPRGRALLVALAKVSKALFDPDDQKIAVLQLSLEGFRADDIHALNPEAPAEIAPFTNALYEAKTPGVLVVRQLYQAGVRTAHCLGAMTCGLGTLPYNLSFIRDLQPFKVRCTSDVLAAAGFEHTFFYGSDATFDEMHHYFAEHHYTRQRTQAELPGDLPKGTWDGITDLAVFNLALDEVKTQLETGTPQFALLMSLSNHSPFTTPQDLPESVRERVTSGLEHAVNHADADDRLRLLTYSYTDLAVEQLFTKLDESGMAERTIVMLMSDHSTGHTYVWGKEQTETDAAKAQIPFAIVIPPAFIARAKNPKALDAALKEVQVLLDAAPLSQNDVPAMLLALLSASPPVLNLDEKERWHTMGGQITSPYFEPGGDPASYIVGINGVSELFALGKNGKRAGSYEDSVFLKTRADRYRVTPRLIPVTATLIETLRISSSERESPLPAPE